MIDTLLDLFSNLSTKGFSLCVDIMRFVCVLCAPVDVYTECTGVGLARPGPGAQMPVTLTLEGRAESWSWATGRLGPTLLYFRTKDVPLLFLS